MAFQEGTSEFTCPQCGAKHLAQWSRQPVRESFSLKCKTCGETLAAGKSLHDYYQVSLTEDR